MKTDFCFGVDYYPEHWKKEEWEKDIALMKETGIEIVRLGEFSWHKMEPSENEFHFEWLREVLDILKKYGMYAILGTPSAAAPKWIIDKDPDILPMDKYGIRRHFGGRHHDCQSNIKYREHIRRFVTAMASFFADHPAVVGWQIDNELGNSHQNLCMCPSCAESFRKWLENKYVSIEELNDAWGTYFWSQEYDSFDQVDPPYLTAAGENPSQMLDWKRFCSDLIVDFENFQVDIIRKICPDHFITHNFMGFAWKVDYFDLGRKLDFISQDQYTLLCVDAGEGEGKVEAPYRSAAALDLMRGIKQAPFYIMEQQSNITGWTHLSPTPRPGQIRLWTLNCVAHGADTISYFRWRSCLGGTEQYWHGILPHSGIPGRAYEEIKKTVSDITPVIKRVRGAMPKNKAAVLFSYDQEYAFQIQPHHPELTYIDNVLSFYESLYKNRAGVDFISEEESFDKYRLLIAPLQYLMTDERFRKFESYVRNGGVLVLNLRAGVKDDRNICMSHRLLPGDLGDIAGIEIPEYDTLRLIDVMLKDKSGKSGNGRKWADIITLKGAEALMTYDSEYYSGAPAVTKNHYGKGIVYYLGTEPDPDTMDILMKQILMDSGIEDEFKDVPKDIDITLRENEKETFAFFINHTDKEIDYCPPSDYECISGSGNKLLPYGFSVFVKHLHFAK